MIDWNLPAKRWWLRPFLDRTPEQYVKKAKKRHCSVASPASALSFVTAWNGSGSINYRRSLYIAGGDVVGSSVPWRIGVAHSRKNMNEWVEGGSNEFFSFSNHIWIFICMISSDRHLQRMGWTNQMSEIRLRLWQQTKEPRLRRDASKKRRGLGPVWVVLKGELECVCCIIPRSLNKQMNRYK